VLALLAVRRMRPRTLREMGRPGAVPRMGWLGRIVRRLPSPSLDGNPVLWREWHRSRPTPWTLVLVVMVFGSTTWCCLFGAAAMFINGVHGGPPNLAEGAGIYGYMLQVVFGLLMFAAVAPTALAEERQRGSLDVLMTTPLSTRTIVLGKWWGTYRFIPLLTFGPGIMAFAMAFGPWDAGGWPFRSDNHSQAALAYGFVLMVLTLMAHGAFLTSLGLALANWIPRMSRAMAISVSAYVLIAIAWPIMVASSGPISRDNPLPYFSPIFVAGALADFLASRMAFDGFLVNATVCDAIVLFAAAALVAATVRTFDRCLDRMPEHAPRPAGRPVRKPPVYEAELIGEWEAG
jgi:ABC-type transport system involved in multi-copper enzyme maturation permease subunit